MPEYQPGLTDASIPEMPMRKPQASQEPRMPCRVISIHAHPDDQEFTVAGTLAKWARAGSEILSVVITDGEAGSNDPSKDGSYRTELARIRREEQLRAAHILGIQETIFLHYPDGELEASLRLRKDLTRLIRKFRPEVVICGDPTVRFYGNSYMNHPDHRAAADAACDAAFPSAGSRLSFPDLLEEGLQPHTPKRVFLHGSDHPDVWIDISATLSLKVEALRQHRSQIGNEDVESRIREWAAEDGKDQGLAYAEAFRVMILVDEGPEGT
jgi:LmbE family N-acetylglucosaminyl deacetylase